MKSLDRFPFTSSHVVVALPTHDLYLFLSALAYLIFLSWQGKQLLV